MIAAIIPARGGSKRLPGKNLKRIGGSTLVELAIKCAQDVSHIGIVAVTTDCEDIAAEAFRCGAIVVPRPAELATDTATSEETALHAMKALGRPAYFETDSVLLLQPTSPLRTSGDIRKLINLHENVRQFEPSCLACNGRPNGAGYIMTLSNLQKGKRFCNGTPVNMPADRSIDIDTAEDLARAQEWWARCAVA